MKKLFRKIQCFCGLHYYGHFVEHDKKHPEGWSMVWMCKWCNKRSI